MAHITGYVKHLQMCFKNKEHQPSHSSQCLKAFSDHNKKNKKHEETWEKFLVLIPLQTCFERAHPRGASVFNVNSPSLPY